VRFTEIVVAGLAAVLLQPGFSVFAQTQASQDAPFHNEVTRLASEFGPRMLASRYLERDGCTSTTYPGWDGFPLQLCEYITIDKSGLRKPAKVILCNPSPEQVARWVVTAVRETTGTISAPDDDRLYNHVICQSGGQFPVAGIVYEDMDGSGVHKAYCFRNGVTVQIEGIKPATGEPLSPEQVDLALTGTITRVRRYARVQSTSPSEYRANGGTVDVGTDTTPTLAWTEVIRTTYQKAWNSDSNELMTALAKHKLGELAPVKPNGRCW
jgi:hypothetical protein